MSEVSLQTSTQQNTCGGSWGFLFLLRTNQGSWRMSRKSQSPLERQEISDPQGFLNQHLTHVLDQICISSKSRTQNRLLFYAFGKNHKSSLWLHKIQICKARAQNPTQQIPKYLRASLDHLWTISLPTFKMTCTACLTFPSTWAEQPPHCMNKGPPGKPLRCAPNQWLEAPSTDLPA